MLTRGNSIDEIKIYAAAGNLVWNTSARNEPADEHRFSHTAGRVQVQNPFLARRKLSVGGEKRLQLLIQLQAIVITNCLVVLSGPPASRLEIAIRIVERFGESRAEYVFTSPDNVDNVATTRQIERVIG